uniref:GRAM domain-containing protein n=1 Tax=Xiphophorus couchianus TaxID=32473 RepID=A0A3B5MJ21_9TELE
MQSVIEHLLACLTGNNEEERRQKRRGLAPADLQLLLDSESEPSESRKKPASKPVEPPSPMLSLSDFETKFDRKKSQTNQLSKTNAHYHKLFKAVSKDELLKQSYTCALQRDMLYQGKMFVSQNWICFHSKVFGKDIKISIPVMSVKLIKKTKTALLVPNALVIGTTDIDHVFVSFLSRNNTFKFLKSICPHLEVDKISSSPVASSCENSFRASCSTSLPLDFTGDFSDLDGVVHQRRQDMMESSSSGSQTPDYDKISGVSDRGLQHMLLFFLVFFLCLHRVSVLVLSSCYMAFKIVALEHRLNSLLSMGELVDNDQRSQVKVNAEIYGELSTNLFKLEKVCSAHLLTAQIYRVLTRCYRLLAEGLAK